MAWRTMAGVVAVAAAVCVLLLAPATADEVSVSPDGKALHSRATVDFLEPSTDNTWIYTDSVRVAVAVRDFDVPEDGRVCVAASWAVDEDGSGDWSCFNNLDDDNVLHAEVSGATGGNVRADARYRIVAQLVDASGVPVSTAATRYVYKPRVPRVVKPGEERDMQAGESDSWAGLPLTDLALLSEAAPTQFWHYYAAKKFVRIISPRNASSVQAKQETGSAKIVLVLRYGQPMVVKEANPEVCVTIDRTMHTCSPATTQVTLPSMPVGRHRFTVHVRSGDGVYYGQPHSVEVVVVDPADPRPARELTWKQADSVDGEPSEEDKARARVLDKFRVVRINAEALKHGRLGADLNDAVRVVNKLKKVALRLVGLGSCDPDKCVEDVIEVQAFGKGQYQYAHSEHVADACVRSMLRRPSTHGINPFASFDACAEQASAQPPRMFTVLFFLNTLAQDGGGATVLPMLDIVAQPVQGRAVWWKECHPIKLEGAAAEAAASGHFAGHAAVVNGTACSQLQRTAHGTMPVDWAGAHKYVAKVHVLFNEHTAGGAQ